MLTMEMNIKLDECCIVLAITTLMLWLKSMRYCKSFLSSSYPSKASIEPCGLVANVAGFFSGLLPLP